MTGGALETMAKPRWVRRREREQETVSFLRRARTWLVAAVLAGAASLVASYVTSIGHTAADLGKRAFRPARQFESVRGQSVAFTFHLPSDIKGRVSVQQGLGCVLNGVVFPEDASAVHHPPGRGPERGGKTWDEDPFRFGGVVAGAVTLDITITGPSDHVALLTGLDFHVVRRRQPMTGVLINDAHGCGAGGVFRYGSVDFDGAPPYWTTPKRLPARTAETYQPLRFPYKIGADDLETLAIDVSTQHCRCSWTAALHISDGDKLETVTVDDDGSPFELTPHQHLTALNWARGEHGQTLSDFSDYLWDSQL